MRDSMGEQSTIYILKNRISFCFLFDQGQQDFRDSNDCPK